MRTFSRIQRKLKRKQDLEIFQQILSMDSETTATKYSRPLSDPEQENDDQYDDERSCSTESSKSNPLSSDTLHDDEVVAAANRQQGLVGNTRRNHHDDDDDDDYISENGMRDMEIELEVPLINYPAADEATQTSTPMDEILKQPQLDTGPRQLSTNDKITEWMRSSEFERFDSLTVENGDGDGDGIDYDNDDISPTTAYTNITITTNNCNINHTTISTDDDKSLIDRLEQVDEIDELQSEPKTEQSRRSTIENTPSLTGKILNTAIPSTNDDETKEIEDIFAAGTASTQASVEIDENFDDTSTYTSLQIAFRNPIDIPLHVLRDPHPHPPPTTALSPPTSTAHITDVNDEGLVVLTNPPAPKIKVNAAQTPPSPTTPTLRLPPRSPSPVPDEMLPPLPPKPQSRISPENSSINSVAILQRYSDPGPAGLERPRRDSAGSSSRPQSQIIIMRTPDQSPTKRQTQNNTPTASPKKKQGFFSRIFSRRKSKADIYTTDQEQAVTTSDTMATINPTSSTAASLVGKGSSKATTPTGSREPSIGHFSLSDANRSSLRSNRSGAQLQLPPSSPGLSSQQTFNESGGDSGSILRGSAGKPVGRSSSSVSGKRPAAHKDADVIHIPLKDDSGNGGGYSSASTITLGQQLDRKTLSALQLADIPIFDGNMELVAIADRQSIKNLCEGAYGVQLDPSVDLSEAEHFALYTSMPPQCNAGDNTNNAETDAHMLNYYQQVEAGHILTAEEVARRLAEANGLQ